MTSNKTWAKFEIGIAPRLFYAIDNMVFFAPLFIPEYRPSRIFSILSSNGWWLNHWPLLGWLETFVKIAAWCFVPYIPNPVHAPSSSLPERVLQLFSVQIFLMGIATILITAAILDRLNYREIISIIFVFPNNWAHWTVFTTMWRAGRNGINVRYARIFFWLMLAGDLIKLLFFAVHDFSRLNISRYVCSTFSYFFNLPSTIYFYLTILPMLVTLFPCFLLRLPVCIHSLN